ncbi:hypothetical protein FB45DRAFT_313873 [Roridomyces roridus]|uniref:RNase III domain-containing protein n=1 Tax=Roridomyces roridus TaxID=1738132 RepID=A0AAD7B6N4_9AGAR|nr:hypothetical protein FB45DRAFT_313873 [Roridomyces roridus]
MPQTPLEATPDSLCTPHLKYTIPQGVRQPLDAPPQNLLNHWQLDGEPNWKPIEQEYPHFPTDYPPPFPEGIADSYISRAYLPQEDDPLEWLGDALIEAVMYYSVYPSASACTVPVDTTVFSKLRSARFLSHIALLYGLQLDDHEWPGQDFPPPMERMCDIFEALVGAAGISLGYVRTFNWLCRLFAPWLENLVPASATGGITERDRKAYYQRTRNYQVTRLAPAMVLNDGPRADPSLLSALRKNHIEKIIGDFRPWEYLDASKVSFGDDYPPVLPVHGIESEYLTAALTDSSCRIHWGEDIRYNGGFRALGTHLYKAVVTILPIEYQPHATSGDLDVSQESLLHRP